MVWVNEVVILLLSVCALAFARLTRVRMERLPSWEVLLTSYYLLVFATVLAVLEGLMWADMIDILEHVCYAGSTLLAAIWCWLALGKEERQA